MVRKVLILMVCVAAVCGLAALSLAGGVLPPADGDALWNFITQQSPYQKWQHFPGYEGLYEGKSPHGAYLKVYINDCALDAVRKGEPVPDGTIIVKENYGKDKKTLMAVTPMYKVKGYNPAGGDWFWAKYAADGKVLAAGQIDGCIRCHSVKKDKDWRFLEAK